jgi:hypothetical protein
MQLLPHIPNVGTAPGFKGFQAVLSFRESLLIVDNQQMTGFTWRQW